MIHSVCRSVGDMSPVDISLASSSALCLIFQGTSGLWGAIAWLISNNSWSSLILTFPACSLFLNWAALSLISQGGLGANGARDLLSCSRVCKSVSCGLLLSCCRRTRGTAGGETSPGSTELNRLEVPLIFQGLFGTAGRSDSLACQWSSYRCILGFSKFNVKTRWLHEI